MAMRVEYHAVNHFHHAVRREGKHEINTLTEDTHFNLNSPHPNASMEKNKQEIRFQKSPFHPYIQVEEKVEKQERELGQESFMEVSKILHEWMKQETFESFRVGKRIRKFS